MADDLYRWAIEVSRAALLVADETSTVRLASPAAERLLGYEPGELVGRRLDSLVVMAGSRHVAKRRDGSELAVDVTVDRRDDATLTTLAAADGTGSVPPRAERGVIVVADDDEVLRELVATNLRDAGYDVLTASDGAEAVALVEANRDVCLAVLDLQMPHMSGLEACIAIKASSQRDLSVVILTGNDGAETAVDALNSGADDFISKATAADVLVARVSAHVRARQQADEKLGVMQARARAAERLAVVVEGAPNAIVMTDRQGTILLVNRNAELLFGYGRDELLWEKVEILLPERFREAHPAHVEGFFAAPQTRVMGAGRELRARRKNGAEVPVEIGLTLLETPDGAFTLASIIDITTRKRAEDDLRRSNAELEQFAYVASHDLQEPLRMVASYTELLAQRYQGKLDERADKYIYYAVDGAKRMQRLVADLLLYSRVGSQGKPLGPVHVDAVLKWATEVLGSRIRAEGATLDVGPMPTVLADEGQLGQLFQNLLSNAIKFRSEAPPQVTVRAEREADFWRFTVADNGLGMEMRYADRVFQMFQRLHERGKYEGSGIGLAIAKRIVERHGGAIGLVSEPGKGTTLWFTLRAPAES